MATAQTLNPQGIKPRKIKVQQPKLSTSDKLKLIKAAADRYNTKNPQDQILKGFITRMDNETRGNYQIIAESTPIWKLHYCLKLNANTVEVGLELKSTFPEDEILKRDSEKRLQVIRDIFTHSVERLHLVDYITRHDYLPKLNYDINERTKGNPTGVYGFEFNTTNGFDADKIVAIYALTRRYMMPIVDRAAIAQYI